MPIVGVGLFYRNGYFRQSLSADGRAAGAATPSSTPTLLPLHAGARAPTARAAARSQCQLPGAVLHAALWRVDVGRVPLLLLDADVPENAPAERAVTDRLYGGDSEHRLRQEILLGIGGVRALDALRRRARGLPHERGPRRLPRRSSGCAAWSRTGLDPRARARGRARAHRLHDAHAGAGGHRPLLARAHRALLRQGGVPTGLPLDEPARARRRGRRRSGRLQHGRHWACAWPRASNGVSRLHGERLARDVRDRSGPASTVDDVPITHVTNGVHAETWVAARVRPSSRPRALGDGYGDRARRLGAPSPRSPTRSCSRARSALRAGARRRGAPPPGRAGRASAATTRASSPGRPRRSTREALTLGFARRVPTYKRLTLLLRERDRLRAHPDQRASARCSCSSPARRTRTTSDGKRLIQQFGEFAARPRRAPPRGHPARLRHGAGARAGVRRRRLAEHAAAPARGLRHERHEGRAERRAQPLDPRRLVGRAATTAPTAGRSRRPTRPGSTPSARDAREAASILDLIEHELAPALLRARRRPAPRAGSRWSGARSASLGAAAARDAHGARLRAAALPARRRAAAAGTRPARRRRCTSPGSVAEATIARRPHEEAR